MPRYKHKILTPLGHEEFKRRYFQGAKTELEEAFISFLYYSGCRISEALNLKRKDFEIATDRIYVNIKRLKGSKQTPPIFFKDNLLGIPVLRGILQGLNKEEPVFPFCRTTGYTMVKRILGVYPHHLRATRITNILKKTKSLTYATSYTGLTMRALDFYVKIISVDKVSEGLEP